MEASTGVPAIFLRFLLFALAQPDHCPSLHATLEQRSRHLGQLVQCHLAAYAIELGRLEVAGQALPKFATQPHRAED